MHLCFHQQYNMIWYLLFSGDPFSTMARLGHTIVYYIFLALDFVSRASVQDHDILSQGHDIISPALVKISPALEIY